MRFQSAFTNATYVIRAEVVRPNPVSGINEKIQKGLRAKFMGPQRIFDTEAAQIRYGWSDEERLEVERGLLTHWDFGRSRHHGRGGLYLAPGEKIPEIHAGLTKPGTGESVLHLTETDPEEVCIFFYTGPDELTQCGEPVALGEQYCQPHLDQIAAAEGIDLAASQGDR